MEGYAAGKGVAPPTWGGGADPLYNLRHSEIIFLKFSKVIFIGNLVSKSRMSLK